MTVRSWFHEQVSFRLHQRFLKHVVRYFSISFSQFLARAIAAAVWTIILQAPLVLILKLLFSGYESLWNCVALMLHFGSFSSIVLIPLSACGLTFSHLKYYLGKFLNIFLILIMISCFTLYS